MIKRYYYDAATGAARYISSSLNTEIYPDYVDADLGHLGACYFPGGVPTVLETMVYTMSTLTGTVDVAWEFTGFPDGSVLTLDGVESDLPDGDFNFTPTTTGEYLMQVTHVAFRNTRRYLHVS